MPRRSGLNQYRVVGSTAYLALTNRAGEVVAEAMVDVADLPMLEEYGRRWSAGGGNPGARCYALHSAPTTYLHRLLCPSNHHVDHINGNPLDNRRANLRPCTAQENHRNKRRHKDGSSNFKGVSLGKNGKWSGQIWDGKKLHHLGMFTNEHDAARAYDRAARVMFGEFAKLNFPDDQQPALLMEQSA